MKTLANLFVANLKILIRNRQALFWSMAFPLMFTVVFGLFFGSENQSLGSLAVINNSETELAESFISTIKESDVFSLKEDLNEEQAREELEKSKLGALVIIPEEFGKIEQISVVSQAQSGMAIAPKPEFTRANIKVVYDPMSAQTNSAVVGFIDNFLSQANLKVQGAEDIYNIEEEKLGNKELTYFDFVLTGIIGMALMNSSIIGIAVGMAKYREDKILKRITTTPLKTWKFIVAEVASRLVVNIFQIALILIISTQFFNAHIIGNIYTVFAIALVGGLLFQLIGFTIASFTKTVDAAQGMATALTIPMMFLTGVFFPIDQLPRWLVSVVELLPLAPLLRMIRAVALESESIFVNPKNFLIVAVWVVACFAISAFKFRLSEE
jgi:ABC-2 type transport system permease protein